MNATTLTKAPNIKPKHDAPPQRGAARRGVGAERQDQIVSLHDCVAFHASASDFSARCSATRTATSVIPSRAAVAVIVCSSSEIERTMSRALRT